MTPSTGSGIVVRTWNDAPISRRDCDGYADATAMCQANGKRWYDYQRLDQTTAYLQALADATGLAPAQLVISTTTGANHLRGTWIHPRLAVDLARWISPAFAVWMDGWFLESIASTPTPPRSKPIPEGLIERPCANCGTLMLCSPQRIYCRAACRVAAHRRRKLRPHTHDAILIRASSDREAARIWSDAILDATLSAVAGLYSINPATTSIPPSRHYRRISA